MNLKYKILEKDWCKRRVDKPKPEIDRVEVPDFKKEHDHFCDMFVFYKNGDEKKYRSRVIYNELKKHWAIDGMHVSIIVLD